MSTTPSPPPHSGNGPDPAALETARAHLSTWRKDLLDLSQRNKLLYFESGRATRIKLSAPTIDELYRALAEDDRTLDFPYVRTKTVASVELGGEQEGASQASAPEAPEPPRSEPAIIPGDLAPSPAPGNLEGLRRLYTQLDRLRKATKTLSEEQGVHTLYLGLGWLEWTEAETSGSVVRSPLVLVPVELQKEERRYRLAPHDDAVESNVALQHLLEHTFRLALPDLSGFEHEDHGLDLERYLGAVAELVHPHGWKVTSEAYLAQFASYKLPMYRDLGDDAAARLAAAHPLVSVLCSINDPAPAEPTDMTAAEEHYSSQAGFTVLDADASQIEVLDAVRRGQSLVVQGPPGTGKSQTIVNIIADALRGGKRVLFVSEKRAALDVVYTRLKNLGLHRVCLELHSHRANRKTVLAELRAALDDEGPADDARSTASFDELRETKQQLDAYVRALWEPRGESQRTAYQVHGRLARLADVPLVRVPLPSASIVTLPPAAERGWRQAVESVKSTGIWDQLDTHPFRHAAPEEPRVWLPADVQHHASRLAAAACDLLETATDISGAIGVDVPATLPAAHALRQTLAYLRTRPVTVWPDHWFARPADTRTADAALVHDAVMRQAEIRRVRDCLPTRRAGSLLDYLEDVAPLLQRFVEIRRRGVLAKWQFGLEARGALRKLGARVPFGAALNVLRHIQLLTDNLRWFEEHEATLRASLGPLYRGLDSDFHTAHEALVWVDGLLARSWPAPPGLVACLTQNASAVAPAALESAESTLEERIRAVQEAISALVSLFPAGIDGVALTDLPVAQLVSLGTTWKDEAGQLTGWLGYRRARAHCETLGLGEFLDEARRVAVRSAALVLAFERTFLQQWVREVYQNTPALGQFNAPSHDALVAKFQDLDRRLHQDAVADVLRTVRRRIPRPLPVSEETRLRREAAKLRKQMPLRRLLPAIPGVLLAHKPCLMMSPLSVAVYLPKEMFRFDLVVFDEASQLPPGDAIGAILRGRQVVVLGDNKQLPPTDFFRAYADDEDEEEDGNQQSGIQGFESVLDIASPVLPNRSLLWHYRSRDERLIAFSNVHFYDRRLVTFPAAQTEDGDELGVRFVHVRDGAWDRGGSRTNSREAERVADLVIEHLEQRPKASLGVVAMNLAQADLIDRCVRRRLEGRPDLAPWVAEDKHEPFFVKNLETVQGDERDEIIISIGYGPTTPGGPPTLQFGPLNRAGGERRWNVAATRARRRVTLVASMLPHELDGVRASAREGPKVLQAYMAYAHRGGQLEGEAAVDQRAPDSDFEVAVCEALQRQGYDVHCQVGSSGFRIDLAVKHPDNPRRYILGIECDGAMYHRAKTTRDRDRLRQAILEDRGWTIHRVWSSDWWTDPDAAVKRITEQIEQLRQGGDAGIARVEPAPLPTGSDGRNGTSGGNGNGAATPMPTSLLTPVHPRPAPAEMPDIIFPPYRAYRTHSVRHGHVITDQERQRLVCSIVAAEEPVHRDLVITRALETLGYKRRGAAITPQIQEAIVAAIRGRHLVCRGDFLYTPTFTPPAKARYAPSRTPEQIAPEEWEAAVTFILQQLGASELGIVQRTTATAFGFDHLTAPVREAVQLAIEHLLAHARLIQHDGLLYHVA